MSKQILNELKSLGIDEETSKKIVKIFHREWKVRKSKLLTPVIVIDKRYTSALLADSGSEAEYLRGHEL